jgi:hypothetical protein
MSKTRKADKIRRTSRRQSWCAWVSLGLGLLPALVGCSSAPHTHSGDPLFGEYYPKGPNGQPMPPANTSPNKTTSAGVPPYPTTNAASSTAAIAGLSGGRPLAIDEKTGTNWTLTNTTNTPPNVPAGNGSPIVQPVPRDTSGPVASNAGTPSNSPPAPVGNSANPPSTILTTGSWTTGPHPPPNVGPVAPLGTVTPEILQSTLQGKGAVGLKREDTPEGVRVSCYVPQRSNPANLRYLETVARDYPTALQALLQQIDQQP